MRDVDCNGVDHVSCIIVFAKNVIPSASFIVIDLSHITSSDTQALYSRAFSVPLKWPGVLGVPLGPLARGLLGACGRICGGVQVALALGFHCRGHQREAT